MSEHKKSVLAPVPYHKRVFQKMKMTPKNAPVTNTKKVMGLSGNKNQNVQLAQLEKEGY